MTLVSIIIPCYRQGHWLAAAVNSCLAQTHAPLEVIVVNDGSDDDTETVAKSFGDRIRYILQNNQGHCAARNHGMKQSRGDFVLFLDGDDVLHPDAVSKLLNVANVDPMCMAMMGWKPFVNDPTEPTLEFLPEATRLIPAMLARNPGPPATMLFPRTLLDMIGGWDVTLKGAEDWDLILRALFAGSDLASVPFVGAYYRQSATQLSKDELMMTQNLTRVLARVTDLARSHPERLEQWGFDRGEAIAKFRNRTASEHAHLAHQFKQRHRFREAAYHYWHCTLLGSYRHGLKSLLKLPFQALRGALR